MLSLDLKSNNKLAQISYDLSKAIYNILKKDINNNFQQFIKNSKIIENINEFLRESKNRNEEIENQMDRANEILLNEKSNELNEKHNFRDENNLDNIYKLYKNNDFSDKVKGEVKFEE